MTYDYSTPITVRLGGVDTYVEHEWLLKLYGDSSDVNVLFAQPETDEELLELLMSKLWRLNNLYTIVDKDGIKMLFHMNSMQHKIYARQLRTARLLLLKSRQIGGSTFASLDALDDALTRDDLSIGLMAQGKEESATLLDRIKLAWEEFPTWARLFLSTQLMRDNRTEFEFNNGSKIFIRTSFRSTTLQRLWISEFAKISVKYPVKALETKTGSMQAVKAGLPVLIESTAERGGMFQEMWEEAYYRAEEPSGKDFATLFIGWTEDPTCSLHIPQRMRPELVDYLSDVEEELGIKLSDEQRWFYASQERELKEYVRQEYPSTPEEAFMAAKDGAYYAKDYRDIVVKSGRVKKGVYQPGIKVEVAMDVGVNDDGVLLLFQRGRTRDAAGRVTKYIVDSYINDGEGMDHYMSWLKKMETVKGYSYSILWLPHDAKQRDKFTATSLIRQVRGLVGRWLSVRLLRKAEVRVGIQRVREMLEVLFIDENCDDVKSALINYSREWDQKLGVWKDKPKHDKYSHMADAIRYMAMSDVSEETKGETKRVSKPAMSPPPLGFAI